MSSESITVLLVEDNMADARMLHEGLKEALPDQFRMTHVRRLSTALEYLWEDTCNVVLLDLGLPDSHGIDTLVLTRAQAPSVPIVVLTGFQDEAMGDLALKEGAQDYLVKGQVDGKLMARSIRYAIARRAAQEALIGQGVALAEAVELQRSRQRLITVHERVRRDVAAQLRGGVRTKLQNLKVRLQGLPDDPRSATGTARLLCEVAEAPNVEIELQVEALSRQLYPPTLSEGLASAFQFLQGQGGGALKMEIEVDDEVVRRDKSGHGLVPEEVGLAVYRIAEEALANVLKHAKATKVSLRLDPPREGWLRLTVRDDGQGFDVKNAPRGLGMGTMQDYAGAVAGECVVRSVPGEGTEVTAVVPLAGSEAERAAASRKAGN
jgi:DNA-binding response OmpR family regulator